MNSLPSTASDRPRPLNKGSDILSAAEWQDVCARLKLTERELEVVVGVFDDLKEAAIASRLGISAHTVHTHLERLYRKLGVNGRGRMIIEVMAEHVLAGRTKGP
jgi:ATP/maltotriose-dependent transcriptional regulator MalT